MGEDYMPGTSQVREMYAHASADLSLATTGEAGEEFDRWLASVKDAAYAEGFAAQRHAEAVLVLRRVLRYAELDASAYTDPCVLGYLNDDLIPWLRARIAEASS